MGQKIQPYCGFEKKKTDTRILKNKNDPESKPVKNNLTLHRKERKCR